MPLLERLIFRTIVLILADDADGIFPESEKNAYKTLRLRAQ